MLDQNTDRMWYVIGAIVIGAAIIAMGLNIFSDSFDSVDEQFASVIGVASENIEGLRVYDNVINPDHIKTSSADIVDYEYIDGSGVWTLDVRKHTNPAVWQNSGLTVRNDVRGVEVPFGERLTVSYEIYVLDGYENVESRIDINNSLDNSHSGNDNDELTLRNYNGKGHRDYYSKLETGKWNKLWYSFSNTDIDKNPNKLPIYDYSNMGVRGISTTEPVRIKVRNIKGEFNDEPTKYVPYK